MLGGRVMSSKLHTSLRAEPSLMYRSRGPEMRARASEEGKRQIKRLTGNEDVLLISEETLVIRPVSRSHSRLDGSSFFSSISLIKFKEKKERKNKF